MNKAEERALEAYPKLSVASVCIDGTSPVDLNTGARKRFIEGYQQAEKDLALTWEDVQLLYIITGQYQSEINKNLENFPSSSQEMFEEILRRFKEAKR